MKVNSYKNRKNPVLLIEGIKRQVSHNPVDYGDREVGINKNLVVKKMESYSAVIQPIVDFCTQSVSNQRNRENQ